MPMAPKIRIQRVGAASAYKAGRRGLENLCCWSHCPKILNPALPLTKFGGFTLWRNHTNQLREMWG
jgi:hypothetical protein